MTGLAFVQLDDDGTGSPLPDDRQTSVARIPLRPGLLDKLEKRGMDPDQAEEVTARINKLLSDENQKPIVGAFDNIGKARRAVWRDPRKLQPTLDRLPALTEQGRPQRRFLRHLDSATARPTTTTSWRPACRRRTARSTPERPSTESAARSRASPATWKLETLPHLVPMTDEAAPRCAR